MTVRLANGLLLLSILFHAAAVSFAAVDGGPNKKCITTPIASQAHDCACDGLPGPMNKVACLGGFPPPGQQWSTEWYCMAGGPGCTSTNTNCGLRYDCNVACNDGARVCTAGTVNCNEVFGCQ